MIDLPSALFTINIIGAKWYSRTFLHKLVTPYGKFLPCESDIKTILAVWTSCI